MSTEASVHRMRGQSQQRLCKLGSTGQNLTCAISGVLPRNLVEEHELQTLANLDREAPPQTDHPRLEVRNVSCRFVTITFFLLP